jgi:hypothetical protein
LISLLIFIAIHQKLLLCVLF